MMNFYRRAAAISGNYEFSWERKSRLKAKSTREKNRRIRKKRKKNKKTHR